MLTCFNVQKHIIFQILNIVAGPLFPAFLKHFLQSPSFRQAQSALIG